MPGAGWSSADFDDLFHSMFEGALGPAPTVQSVRARPDLDIEAELPLSPEEAHHGGTISFSLSFQQQCPACRGADRAFEKACRTCGGAGTTKQGPRLVKVDLPPGVRTGMVIRMPGKGKFSPESGAFGDLLLRVDVRPCP
jgi:DnaJ-class molecular chaperone